MPSVAWAGSHVLHADDRKDQQRHLKNEHRPRSGTDLGAATGVYNVCRDGERVSNRRFAEATGWRPKA